MDKKDTVDMSFVVFLKATLGKMVATNTLDKDFIDLHFWHAWPKKYYSIKYFDNTKGMDALSNGSEDVPGPQNNEDHNAQEDNVETQIQDIDEMRSNEASDSQSNRTASVK